MFRIYFHGLVVAAAMGIASVAATPASAAVFSLIDGAGGENFDFSFGDLTHTSNAPTGVTLTDNGSGMGFGGAGRTIGPFNFDAVGANINVVYRALAGNVPATFNMSLQDTDAGTGVEDYQYTFSIAAGTPVGVDGFLSQSLLVTDFVGRNAAFMQPDGDMVQNFDLTSFAINQTASSTFLEFQSVSISTAAVPEPTSLSLLAMCGLGLVARRKKRKLS